MSNFQNDSIFWIEVEKIKPNPFQPRKAFSEDKLNYLAESIRQYGVLQPLVVTRKEIEKPDGGLVSEYELIAGERRLRASKIAGLSQVPAIIRTESEDEGMKLELAIIENLQREDLNPIDRAMAFERLVSDFGLKHIEIAKKMGKSREYISNSLRLLSLPDEIKDALASSVITEGHARPLMMLRDRPEEQRTLFKEILYKKLTVRDAEAIAKKIAYDKVRRKVLPPDPEMLELEKEIAESLGTRVQIERKEVGGKLTIDFFSNEDLKKILDLVHSNEKKSPTEMLDNYIKTNDPGKEELPIQVEGSNIEQLEKKKEEAEGLIENNVQEIKETLNEKVLTQNESPVEIPLNEDFTQEKTEEIKEEVSAENIENPNEKSNFSENLVENVQKETVENMISDVKEEKDPEIIMPQENFSQKEESSETENNVENKVTEREIQSNEQENIAEEGKAEDSDEDLYSIKDFNI